MACLMKRTPCCRAISPSSCGSMMTKRDLSYSKCRSISGKVPLPIEPKPIMTIGPEIFAWICGDGLMTGSGEWMCCALRE
jgi:PP-loop superfamily ATP-utilizing enzyme